MDANKIKMEIKNVRFISSDNVIDFTLSENKQEFIGVKLKDNSKFESLEFNSTTIKYEDFSEYEFGFFYVKRSICFKSCDFEDVKKLQNLNKINPIIIAELNGVDFVLGYSTNFKNERPFHSSLNQGNLLMNQIDNQFSLVWNPQN